MLPKIVIVGRPNVGKSTLFNRLTGKKLAIVQDIPGVTRDSKEYVVNLDNTPFLLTDTAGWDHLSCDIDEMSDSQIEEYKKMRENIKKQIMNSVRESSVVLFVTDGKAGLSVDDFMFIDLIRKSIHKSMSSIDIKSESANKEDFYNKKDFDNKKVSDRRSDNKGDSDNKKILFLINKIDGPIDSKNSDGKYNIDINEITQFGLDYMYISAQHGNGIDKLKRRISDLLLEKSLAEGKPEVLDVYSSTAYKSDQSFDKQSDIRYFDIQDFDVEGTIKGKARKQSQKKGALKDIDTDFAEMNIAIVGKPNVGKSTLFNGILGYERVITSSIPNTTRDAISTIIDINLGSQNESEKLNDRGDKQSDGEENKNEERSENKGKNDDKEKDKDEGNDNNKLKDKNIAISTLCLIDTAGMRRRSKVISKSRNDIEYNSVGQSISAIKRANVVILMIDVTEIKDISNIFSKQDLAILDLAINEGKGLILIFNKCDMIEKISILKRHVNHIISKQITKVINPPILFTSLLKAINKRELFEIIKKVDSTHKIQIKTSRLNKWLRGLLSKNPKFIKARDGAVVKMKYITQTAAKPPTFSVFLNRNVRISQNHIKFLYKSLADEFGLFGVPIRIEMKSSNNPFDKSSFDRDD